jgi:hypothetical protein
VSRFGLTTYGSYQSVSPIMDAEDCINLFPEAIESGQGKSPMALVGTPGSSVFATSSGRAVWGQKWVPSQNRHFAVMGSTGVGVLNEILQNGAVVPRGNIALPTGPVSMACNPTQLLICAADQLYIFTFATNVLTPINGFGANPAPPFGNAAQVSWVDGFFVATQSNPALVALSALSNGLSWPGTSISSISLFPDNLNSMIINDRQMILAGQTKTVVYANAGAPLFPFQPVPGAYIEQGVWAQNATVQLDNSVFWLSSDDRGNLVAYRNSGYTGIRISNHAVEQQWQSYPIATDAVGYSFQMNGHPWWHIYFPTANVSWRYDVATQMWHKVLFWNENTGMYQAHKSQNHAFAFGKHLVGDWSSGNIYQLSMPYEAGGAWNFATDAGQPIRRERRSPYVQTETQRMFHNRLQLELQVGLGPIPALTDGAGNPRDPQIVVSWSDDGARTWSNDHIVNCGQAGNYTARAFLTRLGSTLHGRVYKLVMTDPIGWYISDGYLDADPGFKPSQRLSDRLKAVA